MLNTLSIVEFLLAFAKASSFAALILETISLLPDDIRAAIYCFSDLLLPFSSNIYLAYLNPFCSKFLTTALEDLIAHCSLAFK